MNTFHLQIVTPDGLIFDGEVVRILVRTTEGDVGIMKGHSAYVSAVDTGVARVTMESGEVKTAMCSGGVISVRKNVTRFLTNSVKWI